jgi:hypothetical protein
VGNGRVRIEGAQQGKERKKDKKYFPENVNRDDRLVHSLSWCVEV